MNRYSRRKFILYWLAVVVGVAAAALGIGLLLFWPLTDWLSGHDVSTAGAHGHRDALKAADAVRGRLLTFGAGVFAAWALWYTARNFWLSHDAHVTDRYTKAIDQLATDKGRDVHIGGIYALERLARDSPRHYQRMVMEVLTAFVREHSRDPWPASDHSNHPMTEALTAVIRAISQEQEPALAGKEPASEDPERKTRPDVQAALSVIGRRKSRFDRERIDLSGSDLTRADLTGAILTSADLTGAILTRADLTRADLTGADLTRADLTGAILKGIVHTDTNFTRACWPEGEDPPKGWVRRSDHRDLLKRDSPSVDGRAIWGRLWAWRPWNLRPAQDDLA